MTEDDFEFQLCDNVNRKILDEYGEDSDSADFPEKERVVVMVWEATGIIENGGFKYLFQSLFPGDSHYKMMIEAFKSINSKAAMNALDKAFALFPGSIAPDDKAIRMSLYEAHPEEELRLINIAFYDAIGEITHCLADYIVKNGLHISWNIIKPI
jgi:hypothetical protein